MKTIISTLIILTLALFYMGCSDSNTEITSPVNGKSAKMEVPFKGSWEGTTEATGFFSRHVTCSGNCTHLGLYTADVYYDITYYDINNPMLGGDLINGNVIMTAANGDKLYLTNVHGQWGIVNPPVEPMVWFTAAGNVDGGTGRFVNAEGTFEGKGKQNFTTQLQEAWYSWSGSMAY